MRLYNNRILPEVFRQFFVLHIFILKAIPKRCGKLIQINTDVEKIKCCSFPSEYDKIPPKKLLISLRLLSCVYFRS